MNRRLLAALVPVLFLAACEGCTQHPRPEIVIGEPATASDHVYVTATIRPNQFAVTEVRLEFGRRPSPNHGVQIVFDSQTASLNQQLSVGLPTTNEFTVTYRLPALSAGEIVDYQFRVTHGTASSGDLYFWSQRQSFTAGTSSGTGVGPGTGSGTGSGTGGDGCDVAIANVSRPATTTSGGSTTDLGGNAPVISSSGQFVAFVSRTQFDANAAPVDQVYRRDVQTGTITAVTRPATSTSGGSVTDQGGRSPSISADGQRVAFVTRTKFDANAADVDQVYVRDLANGTIIRVSTPAGGTTDLGGASPSLSANGRFVAFVTRTKFDANAADVDQIYRRDLQTGEIAVVSRPASAISGGSVTDEGGRAPSISDDGRFVAFVSRTKFDPNATDGDQVYVRDLETGTVSRVSTPAQGIGGGTTTDRGGTSPVISGDGQFVAFVSRTKFDPNAADVDQVYRREVATGAIAAVSRPANGISGGSTTDLGGRAPSISTDGRRVAFSSTTKFDPNATDGDQIYVRDMEMGTILRVTTPATGIGGGSTTDQGGRSGSLSGDGRFVAFVTRTQFDPNAPAGADSVYRRCLPQP